MPTPPRLPLDLTLAIGSVRLTRAGVDALVYHLLALDGEGELVRAGEDTPFAPLEITDDVTDADIIAHLTAPAPFDFAALRNQCSNHSQARLDAFASSLGYDDINTLKAAQLSTFPRFHAEGVAGQAAWDAEWGAAQAFMGAVQSGALIPSFENYDAAIPAAFSAPDYA